ncbi:MAG: bifunctional riboflavin kinase/FAD synthetase [Pseudomonadota bacterium]
MRRHTSLDTITLDDRGASVAMGNFDGVHLGHQAVLDIARARGPLGVVTFEPHPRSHFQPDAPAFRLMSAEARANRMEKLGVHQIYEVPFNADLASLDAQAFTQQVLVDRLGISHVVVGADFCFGKGRKGTAHTLQSLGAQLGFGVTIAELAQTDGQEISSSAIRAALSDGVPGRATAMLGHYHRIEGVVEQGDQRGRDLGFPTANLSLAGLHPPKFGVYATLVDVLTGPHQGRYQGAASLGIRPTFGHTIPNLEVFLLDFTGDLYGQTLSVALVAFQRPELKYEGIEPLIAQMHKDVDETRARLRAL